MKWKLTHKHEHDIIENEGGKTLSYNPNLGIQIIEQDGFAFKDLNQSGELEPFEDWRSQSGSWILQIVLYYGRRKISCIIVKDVSRYPKKYMLKYGNMEKKSCNSIMGI